MTMARLQLLDPAIVAVILNGLVREGVPAMMPEMMR